MQTRFIFFCLKAGRIGLLIHFATPSKLSMVFSLVRAIALGTLGSLDTVGHSCMSPSLAVIVLRDARVHVGFSNGRNKFLYIKTLVNKSFGHTPTLNIPNVDPNN